MKKLHLVSVLALSSIIGAPVFADGLEIKAGVGSVKAANNRAGFDAGVGYAIRLERFFALMPELNFNWQNFDTTGGSIGSGGSSSASTITASYFTFPALINARVYIPMGTDETPLFQPIVTVGAGYGWSSYSSSAAQYWSSGFMYQAMLGGLINLGMISDGSASSTSILIEAGYRGGTLSYAGSNFDWGGYVVRAGVSLNL